MDLHEGGTSIPYWMEDPFIRDEYEALLRKEGAQTRMEPELYVPPKDAPTLKGLGTDGIAG